MEVEVKKPSKSGLYHGGSHASGNDIPIVIDGQREARVEGGEYHLCSSLMQSSDTYEFHEKTALEILEELHKKSCVFRQGQATGGDFIICRPSTQDKEKLTITGTVREITDLLQSKHNCKTNAANDVAEKGGVIIDPKEAQKEAAIHTDTFQKIKDGKIASVEDLGVALAVDHEKDKKQAEQGYGCLMLGVSYPKWVDITSVIDKKDVYDEKGFGIENEPHITLLYGFYEDKVNVPDVISAAKKVISGQVEILATGVSIFESENYDVVKLDVESPLLHECNKELRKFPYKETFPDYKPHLTIGYVKKGEGKKYIKKFEKPLVFLGIEIIYSHPEDSGWSGVGNRKEVEKLAKGGGVSGREILYTDEYGKAIVFDNGEFKISVNSVEDATYIALWKDGKKVGNMYLTPGRNSGTKDYMAVSTIVIESKYRGKGMGLEMYKAALKYSSMAFAGIGGENEQRSNSKQVPSIYRKLGGRQLPSGDFVLDRNKIGEEVDGVTFLEPAIVIDIDNNYQLDDKEDLNELRGKAESYLNTLKGMELSLEENNPEIKFTIAKQAVWHLTAEAGKKKLILTKQLIQILKQGTIVKVEDDKRGDINILHVLRCVSYIMIEGDVFAFYFTLKLMKNKQSYLYEGSVDVETPEKNKTTLPDSEKQKNSFRIVGGAHPNPN